MKIERVRNPYSITLIPTIEIYDTSYSGQVGRWIVSFTWLHWSIDFQRG